MVLEQETMVLEQETIHLGVQLLEVETHQLEEQNMLSQMGSHCCSSFSGCNFFLPLLYRKDKVAIVFSIG
jgi:hypothetical protein